MMDRPEEYSSIETLRDGRRVTIRALRPNDRPALEAAIDRTSPHSLYRRFFAVKTTFSEAEAHYFIDVDFKNHVALVAVVDDGKDQSIVGGGRYVRVEAGVAEVAFTVVDTFQRKGLGSILLRHLIAIGRSAGLRQFTAEVLAENRPMLKVFENSGLRVSARPEGDVVHLTLDL